MKTYDTYIFDLDGTITDTLPVWLGIFRDCLTICGVTPPDDRTLSQHTHDWKQMLLLGLPEAKLGEFIEHAHRLANKRLPAAPLHVGAYEALETLQNYGKRLAIFSTLDRPMFEPAMKYRELHKVVEVAVAGTDVEHRKPHPAGILKALEDLGVPKREYKHAVYIGDKDSDIQAANNAGIDGVLYFPASHQLFYDKADLQKHNPAAIFADWKEVLEPFPNA